MLAGIQQRAYLMTDIHKFSLVLHCFFLECAEFGHKQKQREHLGKRHSAVLPSSCQDIAIFHVALLRYVGFFF